MAILLATVFAWAPISGTAKAESACSFAMPRDVVVHVERNDGRVVYHNSRSRQQLTAMQRAHDRTNAFTREWTPVGLTLTELKYDMRVKVEAIRLSSGRYCARLTAVETRLGYDVLNVHVARRYRPGSCAYDAIVQHERAHVAVFRQALDDYFPRLERRLDREARLMRPIRAASAEAAANRLQQRLRLSVDGLFREMNRTVDHNNARLDTPARYRAERARCVEW